MADTGTGIKSLPNTTSVASTDLLVLETTNETKNIKGQDFANAVSANTTEAFTSSDVADGSATSWTSVSKLTSGEKHSSIFAKMSQMFKNMRYLYKLLGTTDISSIGGGTVTGALSELNSNSFNNILHNIPRIVPKDITSYYTDGTLWKRLNGTNGFSLFEDIYAGDYFKMSRPISAYNQNQDYQATGSQYVTIAEIDPLYGNGDNITLNYHHLVMIPGQGFGGTQHFGRSRMNPTNTTEGGYIGSEMYTTTIGEVATSGSTATTATINQQLYAEFGSHLKTTRELLTNAINATGVNRFGETGGCSNSWSWYSCQAVLMSEIEVYGSIVWSSSGHDTGNANKQFALFANNKQAINNKSAYYWLKDIASASGFCHCGSRGGSGDNGAGGADGCVRPRFVIAA